MAIDKIKLTASQEDYLEAIWALIWKEGIARVGDIAEWLGVSTPSVIGALKTLAKRNLVEYSPHKYVTLSDLGMELAEKISARHEMLRKFLTNVLELDEKLADSNACRIEHAVDEVVSRRLGYFVEFISKSSQGKKWDEQFKAFCAQMQGTVPPLSEAVDPETRRKAIPMTLAEVKPGQDAKIVRINTTAATNRRLAVMGMTRDEVVSVVRIAPLGDPIEVKVRGYSLSLRKVQARGIEVENVK